MESVRFAGGTFVTPYGAQSAAQAAGTCPIAVVAVTDAHGPAAALGLDEAVGVADVVALPVGAGFPHDERATAIKADATPHRKTLTRTVRALPPQPDA